MGDTEKLCDKLNDKVATIDEQLAELYESLAKEDKRKADLVNQKVKELEQVHRFLDSYKIPRMCGEFPLTALERLTLAFENKGVGVGISRK